MTLWPFDSMILHNFTIWFSLIPWYCNFINAFIASFSLAGVPTTYQQGIMPLMTKEETSQYAIRAVVRASTHEDFENKLGRLWYSVGKYDRLTRATIPIPPTGTTDNDDKSQFYLLLSFEKDSDVTSIIERKVLPLIERSKEIFD